MSRFAIVCLVLSACAHVSDIPPRSDSKIVDVSRDLEAVMQEGEGKEACTRFGAGRRDRETQLLCGKWMFFFETFGTSGVPAAIPKYLVTNFNSELGNGFSQLGMVAKPAGDDKLPIGLAPSKRVGAVEALAFTCAACHFARLPDGRFAVGAANQKLDYGKLMLLLTVFPTLGLDEKIADHDPGAVDKLQPFLARMKAEPMLKGKLGATLLQLIPAFKRPTLTKAQERDYAAWPPGTLDFLVAPLPLDDRVNVVSKIPPLWGLPTARAIHRSGMHGAMLGWTGASPSLGDFMRSFIQFGGGDIEDWPDDKLAPLELYLESLRSPTNENRESQTLIAEGKTLFKDKGCLHCHAGPNESGLRVFSFEEIGTDWALRRWLDPDGTGAPCCHAPVPPSQPLTHGLKAPRLNGEWTQSRFLHNGSLASLEQLFCLEPRPANDNDGLSTKGHDFTCRDLSRDEKRALIAYVNAL